MFYHAQKTIEKSKKLQMLFTVGASSTGPMSLRTPQFNCLFTDPY